MSLKLRFLRRWNAGGYRAFFFETATSLFVGDITGGNQELCSEFRFDMYPDPSDDEVYIIGDSSDGGFLVCGECSPLFDLVELRSQAELAFHSGSCSDVQAEYDEFATEYEDDEDDES
ncbi:MAG: hypothetical protein ACK4S4_15675 [Pyrinomonadaceae bacterium]